MILCFFVNNGSHDSSVNGAPSKVKFSFVISFIPGIIKLACSIIVDSICFFTKVEWKLLIGVFLFNPLTQLSNANLLQSRYVFMKCIPNASFGCFCDSIEVLRGAPGTFLLNFNFHNSVRNFYICLATVS